MNTKLLLIGNTGVLIQHQSHMSQGMSSFKPTDNSRIQNPYYLTRTS